MTLCAGVILSVAVGVILKNWEEERTQAEILRQTEDLAEDLERSINSNLDALRWLGKFQAVTMQVDADATSEDVREGFRALATFTLARYRGIHALAWVTRETSGRGNSGTSGRGVGSPEVFRLTYIEPKINNFGLSGIDIGANVGILAAIAQSRDTGELTVISEPLSLSGRGVGGEGNSEPLPLDGEGLLAVMPVSGPGKKDVVSNRANQQETSLKPELRGFILGFLPLADVIKTSVNRIQTTGSDICLYEEKGTGVRKLLAFYEGSTGQVKTNSQVSLCENADPSQGETRFFKAGDRQWTLLLIPGPELQNPPSVLNWLPILGGLLWSSIPITTLAISLSNTYRREQLLKKLSVANDELSAANTEIIALNRMSDLLQACLTVEEACTVIPLLLKPMFPKLNGGVFTLSDSKNIVEAVVSWGQPLTTEQIFNPEQCLALRCGQPYFFANAEASLCCGHVHYHNDVAEYICIPMAAQGEILGVFYLSSPLVGELTPGKQRLAQMAARQIAVALANLKLRDTLKDQSIRDPLTGLFNRRYMEESLEREVRRAERNNQSIGIMMLDVDHFKRFNDTYGHEAGDIILRELSQVLQISIRSSDIACRYGGEEFALIMPEAPLDITLQRAEKLCQKVRTLKVQYRHQLLGPLTISLGVASFPQHGPTGGSLIQAADAALYRAKNEGRDRVCLAS
ncbi:diguanylate cyclase [[Phormidium] sp. ETS-05]|uniref:sensor domain-containing diguanylate cyclase n=1 Tax=[Phormidium] sp. ETS-05 TaxID=222819 RepID=UPI0018EF138E|nr:diguanylate cyclase [[Phormidium] sp. ETS-05]